MHLNKELEPTEDCLYTDPVEEVVIQVNCIPQVGLHIGLRDTITRQFTLKKSYLLRTP